MVDFLHRNFAFQYLFKLRVNHFRQNQVSLREDALDREATLMNVLKSVTANRSEPDLIEAGKVENERKSSGFSFFGMRSKSKENVIDTNPDDNAEEVRVC